MNYEDQAAAAGLNKPDQLLSAIPPELEQRAPGRRTTPMSFALRADLKERLDRFREGGSINVSRICNDAIERELDRVESGNAVVQRLRVELTERHGPSWTMGYQAGRKWAEEMASWIEITAYATRHTEADVAIDFHSDGFHDWGMFLGGFKAPERDYGVDDPSHKGAPSFVVETVDGIEKWEMRAWEATAYWRAWLRAVRKVYEENKAELPSVVDELASLETARPAPPLVDPDDIPF